MLTTEQKLMLGLKACFRAIQKGEMQFYYLGMGIHDDLIHSIPQPSKEETEEYNEKIKKRILKVLSKPSRKTNEPTSKHNKARTKASKT